MAHDDDFSVFHRFLTVMIMMMMNGPKINFDLFVSISRSLNEYLIFNSQQRLVSWHSDFLREDRQSDSYLHLVYVSSDPRHNDHNTCNTIGTMKKKQQKIKTHNEMFTIG